MTYHISHIMAFKAFYLSETAQFSALYLFMKQSQWPNFLALTHIKFIPESGTLHLLERLLPHIFLWLFPSHYSGQVSTQMSTSTQKSSHNHWKQHSSLLKLHITSHYCIFSIHLSITDISLCIQWLYCYILLTSLKTH